MSDEGRRQPRRDAWEQLIRADPAITGTSLLVGLLAASHGDRDGTRIKMSQQTIGDQAGVSVPTVWRALTSLRKLGYLEQVHRGGRNGDGSTRPSEFHLAVPRAQLIMSDGLSPVDNPLSTIHQRAVEVFSTDHGSGLNYSNGGSQLITHDQQPVRPGLPGSAAATSCGRCHPTTHMLEDPITGLPIGRCPQCHPLHTKRKAASK
jgi:hypothetical protein